MKPFQYVRPTRLKDAIEAVASDPNARYIAGGTNLIDLMKRGIDSSEKLVDINGLPLKKIEKRNGFLRIGALALNSQVAQHKLVLENHPLLAQALNAGASGQLRNMATVGGNILQRTRCPYFYDPVFPCNKRKPGAGCGALEGINRTHAIFGVSKNDPTQSCIAVHPSDFCVALSALDATVVAVGIQGERRIPFSNFHRLPENRPDLDTNLEKGELIVAVEIPDAVFTKHIHYLKIRDRASYAFALVSVATALDLENNRIKSARLALGGVAHKPWRLLEVEKSLVGQPVSEATFRKAAELAMQGAKAFEHNTYKLTLTPNAIIQALKNAVALV
ncbi:FAD binding domain-containing protein [Larkinella terrae]|uniref:Xanthine dehydrogenase family protein subunit M n=1 Tax=Larkinella terrae TaxID=2025311 RepID=A0A7K0EPW7_9BACT|nr:xanthine dehydrogenase family protein subunit M [Larkinella terrae]MRS63837.1 xanthine dehydrogenase family protein subunit M [Larkinella terrae]